MSSPYPPAPSPGGPPSAPFPSWNGGTRPIVEPRPPRRTSRLWLHIVLFVVTVASTWWMQGFLYSLSLLTILTAHEFGHYFAARYYRVKATLPYFIPSPFLLGTLGAVIRMSPYIPNRRALFDIAAAGPIAGLVIAIPVSIVGLAFSVQVPSTVDIDSPFTFGLPLLFQGLAWIILGAPGQNDVLIMNNVAFAGWVGLFVTALNLLPISQLDGGHINYAIFGRKSRMIAVATFVTLAGVTVLQGFHYSLILVLLWFMGIGHPPTLNDGTDLGRTRRIVGAALLVVFILCFTPVPIEM